MINVGWMRLPTRQQPRGDLGLVKKLIKSVHASNSFHLNLLVIEYNNWSRVSTAAKRGWVYGNASNNWISGPSIKRKVRCKTVIVKYVLVLESSLSLKWIFKWNTYNIQLWNTWHRQEILSFWLFSSVFSLIWVFPTIFLLKLFF